MLKGVYVNKIEDPDLKTDNVDPEGSNNSRENVTKYRKSDKITIPTQNKFSQLADLADDSSDMETTDITGTGETLQKKVITQINNDKKSAKKPPPLVMHGEITDHNQLVNRTKDIVDTSHRRSP